MLGPPLERHRWYPEIEKEKRECQRNVSHEMKVEHEMAVLIPGRRAAPLHKAPTSVPC